MFWRTIVDEAYARAREGTRPRFDPPAAPEALARAERGLTCVLPGDLRDLLLESNGIMELIEIVFAFDLGTREAGVFAWNPLTAEREVEARSLREFLLGWIAGEISV
jgi:hypothetical protein